MSCSFFVSYPFGQRGDIPLPGLDFDGSSSTGHLAVYRPSTGQFRWGPVAAENPLTLQSRYLGASPAFPVPGRYDNDTITDLAVYSPTAGAFLIKRSVDSWTQEYGFSPPSGAFSEFVGSEFQGATTLDRSSAVLVRGMKHHRYQGLFSYCPRDALSLWSPVNRKWWVWWDPFASGSSYSECSIAGDAVDTPIAGVGSSRSCQAGPRYSMRSTYVARDSQGPGYIRQKGTNGSSECPDTWTSTSYPTGRPNTLVFTVADMFGDGLPEIWLIDPLTMNITVQASDNIQPNPRVYSTGGNRNTAIL